MSRQWNIDEEEFSQLWDGAHTMMTHVVSEPLKPFEVLMLTEVKCLDKKGVKNTGRVLMATVHHQIAEYPIFQIKPYKWIDPKVTKDI